jgi:hypothetical protein
VYNAMRLTTAMVIEPTQTWNMRFSLKRRSRLTEIRSRVDRKPMHGSLIASCHLRSETSRRRNADVPIDKDRFPDLGRRQTVAHEDDVLALVRSIWPGAWQEGSTGSERTWWNGDRKKPDLVAHSWSPRGRMERFHVRILTPGTTSIHNEGYHP